MTFIPHCQVSSSAKVMDSVSLCTGVFLCLHSPVAAGFWSFSWLGVWQCPNSIWGRNFEESTRCSRLTPTSDFGHWEVPTRVHGPAFISVENVQWQSIWGIFFWLLKRFYQIRFNLLQMGLQPVLFWLVQGQYTVHWQGLRIRTCHSKRRDVIGLSFERNRCSAWPQWVGGSVVESLVWSLWDLDLIGITKRLGWNVSALMLRTEF